MTYVYRDYDLALGRFTEVDPLAVLDNSLSSYSYAGNNPVFFNDPLGDRKKPKKLEGSGSPRYDGNSGYGIENFGSGTDSGSGGSATGLGLAMAGGAIVVTSPVWGTALAVGGAVVGVGYAVAQVAGIDEWIDNNWGTPKK